MTRVDESGDEDDLTYSYSGNQLISSTYDSNGNMTYDASSGLNVEWNDLNLIKKVSDGNGVLVNYTYLADGTKIRAVDADGEGLEYRGSLTFRHWFNSPIPGKGKFLKGLSETQLDNMIDDAVKLGTKVKK